MVLSMDRWVGKVAVVTGASVGIGTAIVEDLVKLGLKVVGLARRKEKIDEIIKKLGSQKGKLYSLQCDVSKEEDILKAFKWVDENVGHVQILINNAGIIQDTNLFQGNTNMWKKVFDVNVLAVCIASREAIKIMQEHNLEGHIININSLGGHKTFFWAYSNVYNSSKHALVAITKTFASEVEYNKLNIKVTSISPGSVNTEIYSNLKQSTLDSFGPLDNPRLTSEDVSESVIFALATPPGVQVDELIIQPVHEQI